MIKIFKSHDCDVLENTINNYLKENKDKKVKDVKIEFFQGKDYYYNGEICNQWSDYMVVIIFEN